MTPCYLVEQTEEQRVSLRRFGFGPDVYSPERYECPGRPAVERPDSAPWRFGCDGSSPHIATVPLEFYPEGTELAGCRRAVPGWSHDDPNWPAVCAHCGQPFDHDERWQTNGDPIMRVVAVVPGAALQVGDLAAQDDLPPGAMWFSAWAREWAQGFDGRALTGAGSIASPGYHGFLRDGVLT